MRGRCGKAFSCFHEWLSGSADPSSVAPAPPPRPVAAHGPDHEPYDYSTMRLSRRLHEARG